jgi:IS1 family transposase
MWLAIEAARPVKNSGSKYPPPIAVLTVTATSGKRTEIVIPAEQHTAVGKETGLTAHVERWNNTLWQRLGRFVRKSLSFSKSDLMHDICLRLFLDDYNRSLALSCG